MLALSRATSPGRLLPFLLLAGLACSRDPIAPASPDTAASRVTATGLTLAAGDGLIAFVHGCLGSQLYTMNPDGSSVTLVTPCDHSGPAVNDFHPEVSPDGTKIAFHRRTWYPVVGETTDVYVMNVDGTGVTNLTNLSNFQDEEPTWSPDGSQIAFRSNRNGTFQIFRMNVDGSGVTQVTTETGGSGAREPTWSPDGDAIAYTTDSRGWGWALCVEDLSGGSSTQAVGTTTCATPPDSFFTDIPAASDVYNPDWGPDGRIVFTLYWGDCSSCFNYDLAIVDADFSDFVMITNDVGVHPHHPSWSPDGTRIAYEQVVGTGSVGIGVMNADGTGGTLVITGARTAPHWGGGSAGPPPPPPPPTPECNDGVDNDQNGKIDFPADAGCKNAEDDSEASPPRRPPACSDGRDNDGDGLIDFPSDRGCYFFVDNDEEDPKPQCNDRADNDGDGKVDHENDPGCSSKEDDSESPDPPPPPQCRDGVDNDGDGKKDHPGDRGCSSPDDDSESPDPECGDRIDNDGDGRTDFERLPNAEPGFHHILRKGDQSCTSSEDEVEAADLCEQHAVYTKNLILTMHDIYDPGSVRRQNLRESFDSTLAYALVKRYTLPGHLQDFFQLWLRFFEDRNAQGCGLPNSAYCDQANLQLLQQETAIVQQICRI
jgi:Tol biopolymer transport system component